ncbi:MAG TPA: lipopolysaccharide biosynthesis protein [Gemmatimonadaceae bacterium]|nr:lipopolysaccharide biosynthesis protein [Gemmatimonadaceae bacterium]
MPRDAVTGPPTPTAWSDTAGPGHSESALPPSPVVTPAQEDAARQLDRSLAHGIAWTAGVKWLSQILSWAATLIVARLLTPEDYGLVAMATVFLGLIDLVNEFGVGLAIVQHRNLSDDQIAQINGFSVMIGVGATALACAAAWPLAAIYDQPKLVGVVLALSANFFIVSFRDVPLALLQRDLKFRTVAVNEAVQATVLSVAMVALAAAGFRYWTLVFGGLLSGLLSTVLAYVQRPHRLAWPRLRRIREAVTFGSHIVGSRVGWYIYSNADFFIAGKVLGKAALGAYSFGWEIASIPVQKVSAIVGRVTPSIFSAVQEDNAALRRYLTSITGGIALITMPAALGTAVIAREFVLLALGPTWSGAVVPLQLLALYAGFRSITTLLPQLAQATGLSRFGMKNAFFSAVVMPVAFYLGSRWGTAGIAGAWVVAYPFVMLPLYWVVFRRIEMPAWAYVKAVWPAASSAVLMAVGVWVLRHELPIAWPLAVRFALLVLTGAVLYAGCVFVFHREQARAIPSLLRTFRNG